MKLLIVEDNLQLLGVIAEAFEQERYRCETALSYSEAHERICLYAYDCLIVDLNLPGGSGLDLVKECKRQNPSTGIIIISARNALGNKLEGLDLGADDYLTKPFAIAELIARVKSIIRRRSFDGSSHLTFEELRIDTESREVVSKGKQLRLTKIEYDILLFFISNKGRVLSKECIAEHVWGDHMDMADSFDFLYSHIKNLKKKLVSSGYMLPLKAVYGIGYKLDHL